MEESKEETKTSEPIKGVKSATAETAKRRRRTTAKTTKKVEESEVKTSDDADKSVPKPTAIQADEDVSAEKKTSSKSGITITRDEEGKIVAKKPNPVPEKNEKYKKSEEQKEEKKAEPAKSEDKPKRTRTTRASKKKVEEPKTSLHDSIRIYKTPSLSGFSKVHVNRFITPEGTIGDFTKVSYVKPGFGKVIGYVLTKDLS